MEKHIHFKWWKDFSRITHARRTFNEESEKPPATSEPSIDIDEQFNLQKLKKSDLTEKSTCPSKWMIRMKLHLPIMSVYECVKADGWKCQATQLDSIPKILKNCILHFGWPT